MSTRILSESGKPIAEVTSSGWEAVCLAVLVGSDRAGRRAELCCHVRIQRAPGGDLADGVRAHYKTVHPEKRL
jgi:hypothetical protein